MDVLIKATQFILSLSLLIVLHELGHFIPAKLFKTKVEKFYLFFDYKFSLLKKKIGETEYGIGWIPLGGYVKIAGMIDESMDVEQMKKEPQPWEFRSKPAWQRLIIMLGGVTVNFLLGWLIYVGMVAYWGENVVKPVDVKNGFAMTETFTNLGFQNGDKIIKVNGKVPLNVLDINKELFLRDVSTVEVLHSNGKTKVIEIPEGIGSVMWKKGEMEAFQPRIFTPVIDTILPKSLAFKAGMIKGDKIVRLNNIEIAYWSEFLLKLKNIKDDLKIVVKRGEELKEIDVPFKNVVEQKIGVGISPKGSNDIKITKLSYSLKESFYQGSLKAYWALKDYIYQFKYVFTPKGASSLGGFISIGKIFPSTWSWKAFWGITAFLSIMLGFMNLLPIPALDGGHVVFTLWEMITGRKPSDRFLEYAQMVGVLLLLTLMIFANGNDIYKAIFK